MNHDHSDVIPADPFSEFFGSDPVPASSAAVADAAGQRDTYSRQVTRKNPGCVLFICDQSASMDESFAGGGRMKGAALADIVNKSIAEFLARCMRAEGCRHYFDIGVIGYGAGRAYNALGGPLSGEILQPITRFEAAALRVEQRATDLSGAALDRPMSFPIWVEPRMSGDTPTCTALRMARDVIEPWCRAHPESYPPTVIHVTDGQSTDGDPSGVADDLRRISTDDGQVLLFNLHIATTAHEQVLFPSDESRVPDTDAKRLFAMSSEIPACLEPVFAERKRSIAPGSRFFGYNAGFTTLAEFIKLGTTPGQLR